MGFEIGRLTRLNLGYVGEDRSRLIEIDVAEWLDKWPEAVITLIVCKPGESMMYFAPTTVENGILSWQISRADVSTAGHGYAQFRASDAKSGTIYKSRVVETIIHESIDGAADEEAPDAAKGWVDQVLDAAQSAQSSEQAAAEYAERTEQIAEESLTAIASKGQSVLASIPDDYVSLSDGLYTQVRVITGSDELFHATDAVIGKTMNNAGAEVSNGTLYISGYIPVQPERGYIVRKNLASSAFCNCWYNPSKGFIASAASNGIDNGTGSMIMVAPAGAAYLRVTGSAADVNDQSVREIPNNEYAVKKLVSARMENFFSSTAIYKGYGLNATGGKVSNASLYTSEYMPVAEETDYTVSINVKSSSYFHVFYDEYFAPIISCPSAVRGPMQITSPKGARWLRVTGMHSEVDKMRVFASDMGRRNQVRGHDYRKVLASVSGSLDGHTYCAFPDGAMYRGKEYHCAYLANSHTGAVTEADVGEIVFFVFEPNGAFHIEYPKIGGQKIDWLATFGGEPRDPFLAVTSDGSTLLLSAPCEKLDGSGYEGYVIALDAALNVTSYCKTATTTDYFVWGAPLQTPEGYLLLTQYTTQANDYMGVLRSSAPFTGDLTGMTFVFAAELSVHQSPWSNECCLGYWGDKLVAIYRTGGTSKLKYTSNMEGTDGWLETPIDLGYQIHSPKLLPRCDDNHLIFLGSHYQEINGGTYRYPCIGLIDPVDYQVVEIVDYDTTVQGGGYPSAIRLDSNRIATAYYTEQNDTYAGVYHRVIDLQRLYGFVDRLDDASQMVTVKQIIDAIGVTQ